MPSESQDFNSIPEVVRRARLITRFMLLFVILSALARAQVVVTDDANTSSFYPTKNFGGSIALLVGCGSNSYVKFSLANLGSGVTSSNVSKGGWPSLSAYPIGVPRPCPCVLGGDRAGTLTSLQFTNFHQ